MGVAFADVRAIGRGVLHAGFIAPHQHEFLRNLLPGFALIGFVTVAAYVLLKVRHRDVLRGAESGQVL
jgi:hypothetical protein